MKPAREVAEEGGVSMVPQFWLYGESLTLVCQRCDTNLFRSSEDADFADLEKAVQAHVCAVEGAGRSEESTTRVTLDDVFALAQHAHRGQVDKLGVPYFEHVRAVADGLAPFGEQLQMAGLLHDIIEDTDWTAAALIEEGIPPEVVTTVEAVTNTPGVPYLDKMQVVARDYDATLLKIADNAHNSRQDRAAGLPPEQRKRLAKKYAKAREILWADIEPSEIASILEIVNPDLLGDLRQFVGG
jgi:(p)ppGpp synthase/HD superfamily hydrolase